MPNGPNLNIKINLGGIQRSTSYSPTYPRRRTLSWIPTSRSVQVFDSEYKDYTGQKFRTLVHKIRNHLTSPESYTREHFETVVQRTNDIRPSISPNCTVDHYFRNCFPNIQLMSWGDKEIWGLVKPDVGNQIQLRASMVIQYEKETDPEASISVHTTAS